MRQCKLCNTWKDFNYIGLNKRGKSEYRDEDGKLWIGHTCYSCHLEYLKSYRIKKFGGDKLELIICSCCSTQFKQSSKNQKYCSKSCYTKNLWKNKKEYLKANNKKSRLKKAKDKPCKQCNKQFKTIITKMVSFCTLECKTLNRKEYAKNYYGYKGLKNSRSVLDITCLYCSKVFQTKEKKRKYCSKYCFNKSSIVIKPEVVKVTLNKVCLGCSTKYSTFSKIQRYCTEKCKVKASAKRHRKKRKAYEKLRELKKKSRVPKWADNKAMEQIYKLCPKDRVVDHIIPLNGDNVCGFHVEYNLQYLSPEENGIKSNKCDGTYDNKTYKLLRLADKTLS